MKLNAALFLAFSVSTMATVAFFIPKAVEALGQGYGDEMRVERGPLTPEQLAAKQAQHEARHAEREAQMQEALDLTEQQVEQIAAIKARYNPQKEALRAQKQALREDGATRAEIKAATGDEKQVLREQINLEMRSLLTPEQVELMEALKKYPGGRGKDHSERGN